jgi:plastocyanin
MTGSRVGIVVASIAALLMVTAFAGAVDASPSRGDVTTILAVASTYSSPHWTPNRVKIDPGTRVEWSAVNDDHVLEAYGDNWTFNRSLPEGASVTKRFRHRGIFLFRCTIHSTLVNGVCQGMCGKVVVH